MGRIWLAPVVATMLAACTAAPSAVASPSAVAPSSVAASPLATPTPRSPGTTPAPAKPGEPIARGYHSLLDIGQGRLWLYGGSNALPRSGGVWQRESWVLLDGRWTRSKAEAPPASAYVAVWDPDSARVIVVPNGGTLYLYDPASDSWETRAKSGGPLITQAARGGYDTRARRVVVFGERTWAYDVGSDTWTEMKPNMVPPARRWPNVAYHSRAGVFVTFGGSNLGDTWTYDLASDTWKEMRPARAPSDRQYSAMAYDSRADRIVLFGGAFGAQDVETPYEDTWIYDLDPNEWTQLTPAQNPGPRGWHAMAFEASSGRTALFGGGPHRDGYQAGLWWFDTTTKTWIQQ